MVAIVRVYHGTLCFMTQAALQQAVHERRNSLVQPVAAGWIVIMA